MLFCLPAQDNLKNKGFGQDLPSVENEVEEHNIFQSEVEALAPHISTSGDKVKKGKKRKKVPERSQTCSDLVINKLFKLDAVHYFISSLLANYDIILILFILFTLFSLLLQEYVSGLQTKYNQLLVINAHTHIYSLRLKGVYFMCSHIL